MIQAVNKPKGAIEVDVKQKQLDAIKERSKDAFIIPVQLSGSNLEEIFSSFLDMIQASHNPKGAIELDVKQKQLDPIKEDKRCFYYSGPALGFQEHNFVLSVKGNRLKVSDSAVSSNSEWTKLFKRRGKS
ncbi:hypothetical protein Tco_1183794 [Tanacetum coccineum]